MNQRVSIDCFNPQQAHSSLQAVIWPWVKAMTVAGNRIIVEARPETRSSQENRMLHALIGEIAAQKDWAGAKRDAEIWKRLLVAAWCRTRGESVEILPALDGHGVDIVPARTSKLTKGECADLIEYVQSWVAQNGVRMVDFETGEITGVAA